MNPASWLSLAAGDEFTQPTAHSFAQPCMCNTPFVTCVVFRVWQGDLSATKFPRSNYPSSKETHHDDGVSAEESTPTDRRGNQGQLAPPFSFLPFIIIPIPLTAIFMPWEAEDERRRFVKRGRPRDSRPHITMHDGAQRSEGRERRRWSGFPPSQMCQRKKLGVGWEVIAHASHFLSARSVC